jgi:hypothetical protein
MSADSFHSQLFVAFSGENNYMFLLASLKSLSTTENFPVDLSDIQKTG